jgi:hypothetical protein
MSKGPREPTWQRFGIQNIKLDQYAYCANTLIHLGEWHGLDGVDFHMHGVHNKCYGCILGSSVHRWSM